MMSTRLPLRIFCSFAIFGGCHLFAAVRPRGRYRWQGPWLGCARMSGDTQSRRAARLDARDSRTVSIKVGIQNGGMATALALGSLHSPAAALAAAVFGPWSALAAAMLAVVWSRRPPPAGRRAAVTLERLEKT
jgi:predicted Na+-dependent transporter